MNIDKVYQACCLVSAFIMSGICVVAFNRRFVLQAVSSGDSIFCGGL